MEQQKGSTSKEMIWALRWSVALRTFYRQILSLLYSSFPFGNFRPRLVRALLVYYVYGSHLQIFTRHLFFHTSFAKVQVRSISVSYPHACRAQVFQGFSTAEFVCVPFFRLIFFRASFFCTVLYA